MARWLVKLDGEDVDVEEFPLKFPDGELYAVEKDGGVYLTGPEFERLGNAEAVRNHALVAVDEMSAVISLLWWPFRKPRIGNVYREDAQGGLSTWMTPVTGVFRAKGKALLRAVGTNANQNAGPPGNEGPPEHPSLTEAQQLLLASRATGHLRTATLLWAAAERPWWLLFRIAEEIERHLQERSIAKSLPIAKFCTTTELKRFRGSANSAEVSGLLARHAARATKKPLKNPMSLEDGKRFVQSIFEQALRRKNAGGTNKI